MEHDLESIIARLEILEIGVCNIIHNPGNIGNHSFSRFWTPGDIGNLFFSIFRISWKYWKYICSCFLGFLQKRRAPKFHAEWSSFRGEISHMRPIQGQKLKLFQPPILPLFFPSSKPLATTMHIHPYQKKQAQTAIPESEALHVGMCVHR